MTSVSPATTFAAVFVALYAAHLVGDHWVQTTYQAQHKDRPGWPGRLACLRHVLTYTVTAVAALMILASATDLELRAGDVLAGLSVSAVTHYVADRREPLRRIAKLCGSSGYIENVQVVRYPGGGRESAGPGTALFHLDQSWHVGWIFIAALIIA